ncbi:GvpL/GvpF family gas vesicle protein [Streptomyces sp. t39]|uniref:GvpL/GvpF family gas vesicle protein n=1 Tax=Streptomyces sp. t39 TaxID=1828156 RepID=UPI0011CE9DC4|nr:GvpL/GvpF family gas vesicle protein [Streptomyces sp. t39]TXS52656.1 gas vesicle synthesis protein [Streptomyces sp. t39]
MSETPLLYVYVVGFDGNGLDRVTSLTAGIDGGTLRPVSSHRGLTALVSSVPADRFGEENLPAQLEDLGRLEAVARAHHAVVDTAFAETTVLPMRLATVYRDEARVAAMLDERHDSFGALLRVLDGHVELGVKVYAVPQAAPAPQEPAEEAAGSPGRAYLQRRRAARRTTQDTYRAAAGTADAAARLAGSIASARTVHRPQQGEWSAGRGENVANEAYLVPLPEVERFRAELGALAQDTPGVAVEVTGPWAPYSFATEAAAGGAAV